MKSLRAMMASLFGHVAAADLNTNLRHPKEAYPDLGLPRPAHVQADLKARAEAKRARRAALRYTKTLDNGRTILQTVASPARPDYGF